MGELAIHRTEVAQAAGPCDGMGCDWSGWAWLLTTGACWCFHHSTPSSHFPIPCTCHGTGETEEEEEDADLCLEIGGGWTDWQWKDKADKGSLLWYKQVNIYKQKNFTVKHLEITQTDAVLYWVCLTYRNWGKIVGASSIVSTLHFSTSHTMGGPYYTWSGRDDCITFFYHYNERIFKAKINVKSCVVYCYRIHWDIDWTTCYLTKTDHASSHLT